MRLCYILCLSLVVAPSLAGGVVLGVDHLDEDDKTWVLTQQFADEVDYDNLDPRYGAVDHLSQEFDNAQDPDATPWFLR